jgi:tetratricopeptide (TPR) repeat protein
LAYLATHLETTCPGLLAELGRTREALERAGRLAATLEAKGVTHLLIEVRSVELASRLACGERKATPAAAEWLIQAARESGSADMVVLGLAAAASRLPDRTTGLLAELEQSPGTRETTYFARQLPAMLRTALAAGDPALAKGLAEGLELRYPLQEHALCSARAQLAEHAGDYVGAAALYAEAAERWREFGNVPEHAYALLGQGRCLLALGRPGTEKPFREARDLFATMGYRPALAETEALLEQMASARRS